MSQAGGQEGLPTFNRPPVAEVVLGVQFEPLPVGSFQLAGSYELWRETYPRVEEHPAIPAVPQGGFFIDTGVPGIRYWFINEDNTNLIQLQRDRMILNWRAQGPDRPYPRYSQLRGEIERRLADFSRFAERLDTGIKPVATEVTYINVIGGEVRVQLDQVLNFVSRPPVASLGPDAIIDTNIQIRFDTTTETGRTSNLTLSAGRDNSRDPAPIVLQLSSHAEVGDAPVTDALDLSHRLVVTSFRDLTTSTMHSEWGLV